MTEEKKAEAKRQFVRCAFGAAGGQGYTYHWDGAVPLAVGDRVEVETKRGKANVEVVGLCDGPPDFATKAVLGKVPGKLF